MTPILYLIPCTLGDTDLNNVLPAANASIVTSLKYFIVENIRTARRFLKKVDRNINIDELVFFELNGHTKAEQISTFRMVVDVQGEVSGIDKPGVYTNLAQWLLHNGTEGQVAVSLEMEDLRIGTDGTVYQTAGEAVRTQLTQLERDKVDKTDFTAFQNQVQTLIDNAIAALPVYEGEVEDI